MAEAERPGAVERRLAPEPRGERPAPDESIRTLDSNARAQLLERMGDGGRVGLPGDRDLVLVCDVRAFPLADVLGLVHNEGKSGLLFLTHAEHAKVVYLRGGEVVFASSNQRVDRLGSCLVRSGVITLEQLREAERSFSPSERFGKVLVELGFLTPRELWNGVKFQVEEVVRSLFAYTSGTVYFWEGEVQPDNVVRLALPTRRLVAEGLQRRDELMRFLAALEDARTRLETDPTHAASLAGAERRLFEAVAEEGAFPAACRRVGLDPLSGARTVQMLRLVGAVRMSRGEAEADTLSEADLRDHDEDLVRECVTDHLKLLEELEVPLVALEGPAPVRERLARVVGELGERYPGLLRGVEVGHAGLLDPEEIVRRALRLPGERASHVRAALGELVAYLEFELKNHPRIDDPDRFLVGIETLRARLAV
jgi:hypothetical protein